MSNLDVWSFSQKGTQWIGFGFTYFIETFERSNELSCSDQSSGRRAILEDNSRLKVKIVGCHSEEGKAEKMINTDGAAIS